MDTNKHIEVSNNNKENNNNNQYNKELLDFLNKLKMLINSVKEDVIEFGQNKQND